MIERKNILSGCLAWLFICIFYSQNLAQDPIFSQYYYTPLQINPAFAGNSYGAQFYANYRNQWPAFDTYTTYGVSYDQRFERMNSGVGLYIVSDDAGDGTIRNTQINGMYSYRLIIDRNSTIKFGLEAGFTQSRLDWSKLIFYDQLDPQFGAIGPEGIPFPSDEIPPEDGDVNNSYFDVSAGVLYYTSRVYAGISFKHMNQPDYSYFGNTDRNRYGNLPLRTTILLGYQHTILRGNNAHYGNYITPSLLYVRQGDFYQIDIGSLFSLNQLIVGGYYRQGGNNQDAVIGTVGWRYENMKFGYSYDFTVSELGIGSQGTHEVGISVNLGKSRDRESRYNDCFAIFR